MYLVTNFVPVCHAKGCFSYNFTMGVIHLGLLISAELFWCLAVTRKSCWHRAVSELRNCLVSCSCIRLEAHFILFGLVTVFDSSSEWRVSRCPFPAMCLISRRLGSCLCFRYEIKIDVLKRIMLGTLHRVSLSSQVLASSNKLKRQHSSCKGNFL